MYRDRIMIAGYGGQGVLRIGQMIAYGALGEGKETSWLPSYGAEMRGGTASCDVIVSDSEIPYPMITQSDICIAMNEQSFNKYEGQVRAGGTLIVNSSLVFEKTSRTDITAYYIPADLIAENEGNIRGINMVLLGAYLALSNTISKESIFGVIERSFTGKKAKFVDSNKRLVDRGYDFVNQFDSGR